MKPYAELTRTGRLRRLRELAVVALDAYGMSGARLKFEHYEGNVVFRVDCRGPFAAKYSKGPYVRDRYALRIHTTGNAQAIESELRWLASLSREGDLPVPEPVANLRGQLLTPAVAPGVPQARTVSLMRWLDGRRLYRGVGPHHARAWGRLMARLHAHAADWRPSEGFRRPHWDWDGLFGRDGGLWFETDDIVASMPSRYQEPFETISHQVRGVMNALGKGPDAYGMLHADMYLENVLFKGREVYAIDFDDCGFGFWLFDIGITLSEWLWTEEWPWFRDTFLDGYAGVRSLPESQLKHLDLFMATRFADLTLWGTAFIMRDPQMRAHHEEWRDRAGDNLVRYLREL